MSKLDAKGPDALPRLKRTAGFGAAAFVGVSRNAADEAGVSIRETLLDIVHLVARAGSRAVLAQALLEAMRLPLPDTGRSADAGGFTILATGPDSWRIFSAPLPAGALTRRIKAATGASASCVDLSHGLATLQIGGTAVRDALARLCRLDLDPAVFRAGDVAETIMAQTPVMLWRKAGADVFGLAVPLTFAHSFAHALIGACQPFGLMAEPVQE